MNFLFCLIIPLLHLQISNTEKDNYHIKKNKQATTSQRNNVFLNLLSHSVKVKGRTQINKPDNCEVLILIF